MKKKAIVSACLLGVESRYDGGSNKLPDEKLRELKEKYELIPVCPECYGGLTTPRIPSERVGDKVLSKTGTDVTAEFARRAQAALYLARLFGADIAILKENSPSCGFGRVYDGSFSKKLVEGNGIAADLLYENGIEIFGEESIDRLM